MPLSQPLVARSRATVLFSTAGAALLAAQALLPALPSGIARQVAVAAGHRGGEAGSAVAFLLAAALLVLAAAATNRLDLTRGRALTRVGLVLTGIGALWPAVGRASYNAILVALTGNGDRSVAVSAVHTISGSGAFAMFLILLLAFVTGPIVLALGLRRAGLLPIWPALLWLVGCLVVNGAESSSRVAATIGMAAVAVALSWIGVGAGREAEAVGGGGWESNPPATVTAAQRF